MGAGVTFLPGLYVRTVLKGYKRVKTLELRGKPVFRTIGMVWRKSSARHANYDRLAELFRGTIVRDFSDFAPG